MLKFFCTILFLSSVIYSQQPTWKLLPGSPSTGRVDDLSFVNSKTGWAGNGAGRVYKTTNGGLNWVEVGYLGGYCRSICFIDSLTGFAGLLSGSNKLMKTTNGAINWSVVPLSVPPSGICGLSHFGSTLLGSGVWTGTPTIVISTNRGESWQVIDMSTYAGALVDCYLTGEGTGFVIGRTNGNRSAVILYTSNSGATWSTSHTSARDSSLGWKISFPTPQVGYVSVFCYNSNESPYFLKTTDGGATWMEKDISIARDYYYEEGIGFVNENTGWVGGESDTTYMTTDGGETWFGSNLGIGCQTINRIRFYGDTLGYAGGCRIFKFTRDNSIGINGNNTVVPVKSVLHQNYPNPFNPVTIIKYEIFEASISTIKIYDAKGEEVYNFTDGYRPPGIREFKWYGMDNNGSTLPSGVYFYKLETENHRETKKMVLIR